MMILKFSIGNAQKKSSKFRDFFAKAEKGYQKITMKVKEFKKSSRVTLLYESSSGNQVGGLPLVSVFC